VPFIANVTLFLGDRSALDRLDPELDQKIARMDTPTKELMELTLRSKELMDLTLPTKENLLNKSAILVEPKSPTDSIDQLARNLEIEETLPSAQSFR